MQNYSFPSLIYVNCFNVLRNCFSVYFKTYFHTFLICGGVFQPPVITLLTQNCGYKHHSVHTSHNRYRLQKYINIFLCFHPLLCYGELCAPLCYYFFCFALSALRRASKLFISSCSAFFFASAFSFASSCKNFAASLSSVIVALLASP